jgi:hypothetical protein
MRWTSTDTVGFGVAAAVLLIPIFLWASMSPVLSQGRPLGVVGIYAIFIAIAVALGCSIVSCWINGKMTRPTWVTHVGVAAVVLVVGFFAWRWQ